MTSAPERIGVNALFLEPGMGGLETYVREVVPRMAALAPRSRLTVVCNPRGFRMLSEEGWGPGVDLACPPVMGSRGLRALSETTALGAYSSRRFDVLLNAAMTAPLSTRSANVVLLADLTWLKIKDLGDGGRTAALWRRIVPPAVRRADRVIALTGDGREEIVSLLGVPADRVDVIGLGFDEAQTAGPTPEAELRLRLGLGAGPVVLNLAAKKAHKNLVRLVEAHATVVQEVPDAQLVMPGAPTPYEDLLRSTASRLGIEASVVFPGFVSDADREGLYAIAGCLAFPSLNEGFGLPLLEAMARDVPVVTSSVSAMPEVAGDAALLVDPKSAPAIASAIVTALTDEAVRDRLLVLGRERITHFRWEEVAGLTLDSLTRAAAEKKALA